MPTEIEGERQQTNKDTARAYLVVRGIVQGVGFRPFVYRIAQAHQLTGWVLNSTEGVEIEVEGAPVRIRSFIQDLSTKAPPLASIYRIDVFDLPPAGYSSFMIETSDQTVSGVPLVSPDIATCPDCLAELFDAANRRYRYPFINCTNCGPRFTIIEGVPYDRGKTTMKAFAMCPACQREYDDPADRRFHAQPNACPQCGPSVWLVGGRSGWEGDIFGPVGRADSGQSSHSEAAAKESGAYPNLDPDEVQLGTGGPHPNPLRAQRAPGRERGQDAVRRERELIREATVGSANLGGIEPEPLADTGHAAIGSGDRNSFSSGNGEGVEAIAAARRLLKAGAIVAVKGLGGFHLACDATNAQAVDRLRTRKRRVEKPFAIMVRDLETVSQVCYLSDAEAQLLHSARRPIVLLERRPEGPVAPEVAPHNGRLGVMLPYTPIHHLLLEPAADLRFAALVMTSGNLSEEPIAKDNDEALDRLASLADYFLLSNRPIHVRADDSVTQVFAGKETIIRRSRGYAPLPVRVDFDLAPVLACGAELKNTFCLAEGNYAFLSQHVGDLENQETMDFFAATIEHFVDVFNLAPRTIAHDLHPDYLSTRYALSRSASDSSTLVAVQHHHAHIASCMAENGLDEPVIGVAFDGTGYGADGTTWGGEFLIADYVGFERAAHLKPVAMPGGEAAIRRPYRMALSYLLASYGGGLPGVDLLRVVDPAELAIVVAQVERGINSSPTSSCGRLFDAVSALLGIRGEVNYEGQAAIELEMAVEEGVDTAYRFDCAGKGDGGPHSNPLRAQRAPGRERGQEAIHPLEIDATAVIRAIVGDLRTGEDRGVIAAKFHNGVAQMIVEVCGALRERFGLSKVCLSGGVFQNRFLLCRALDLLKQGGFEVYIHHVVPCNDGGISLGQAIVASRRVRSEQCTS